mmetsp:Transcript_24699/g.64837  ORF Transcript_24699/g.64837 Transcript_24699/m.64837 type:complete len:213 (+) Transcript_24699:2444-3082(+)
MFFQTKLLPILFQGPSDASPLLDGSFVDFRLHVFSPSSVAQQTYEVAREAVLHVYRSARLWACTFHSAWTRLCGFIWCLLWVWLHWPSPLLLLPTFLLKILESRTAGERSLPLERDYKRDDVLFCQASRRSCFQKRRAATFRQPDYTKQIWRLPELTDAMQHAVRLKQRSAVSQSMHSEPLASTSATTRMFTEPLSSCFCLNGLHCNCRRRF